MADLSRNFSVVEFRCSCCGKAEIKGRLVHMLQRLRDTLGQPIHVNSGYRCLAHDMEVNSGPSSRQHTKGLAADIWADNIDLQDLARVAWKLGFKGVIAKYPMHVHVDMREGSRYMQGVNPKLVKERKKMAGFFNVKSKTFWGGIAGIATGIGLIIAGSVEQGAAIIWAGIMALSGRHAIAKLEKKG